MKWKRIILLIMFIVFLFEAEANPLFNTSIHSERHGLLNHEIVLNVTNNGVGEKYNFRADFDGLNSDIKNQEVEYLKKTPYSWFGDVYERNLSSAHNCTGLEGTNYTCYDNYFVRTENRNSTIEEWTPTTLIAKTGKLINATAKTNLINIETGESVLVRLKWLQPYSIVGDKKSSYGNWSINPSGTYNTSYGFWRALNITANSSNVMPLNFTVNLTLPKEVIGNATANGNDIIVVYDNSGTESEIHRINSTPFQEGSSVNIWFRLQKSIATGATDRNYSIYYNTSNPALPLNLTSQIFSRIPEMNETGCVVGYPFREGAGTQTNDTCNNNRGTFNGNPQWNASFNAPIDNKTFGIDGDYALSFDEVDDWITVPQASNLITGVNNWTISEWINPNSNPSAASMGLQYKTATYENIYLMVGVGADMWASVYAPAETNLVPKVINIIEVGVWQMFTLTKSGNDYVLYKNGVSISSGTATVDFETPTVNYFIGANWQGTQEFHGLIDEFYILNRALTADEVYYHYWRRAFHQNAWNTSLGEAQSTASNTAPTLTNILFNQSIYFTNTAINISFNYTDIDGDLGTVFANFSVNGVNNSYNLTGVSSGTRVYFEFLSGNFSKEQNVSIVAFANDGTVNSLVLGNYTIINNTPVTISQALFNQTQYFTNTNINTSINFTDIDGDLVQFNFSWFVDTNNVFSLNTTTLGVNETSTLMSGNFSKHQRVGVNITTNDGNSTSNIAKNFTFINDSKTLISLNLPRNNTEVTYPTIYFNVSIFDADNDTINISLYADLTENNIITLRYNNQSVNDTINNITWEFGVTGFNTEIYFWKVNTSNNQSNTSQSNIFRFDSKESTGGGGAGVSRGAVGTEDSPNPEPLGGIKEEEVLLSSLKGIPKKIYDSLLSIISTSTMALVEPSSVPQGTWLFVALAILSFTAIFIPTLSQTKTVEKTKRVSSFFRKLISKKLVYYLLSLVGLVYFLIKIKTEFIIIVISIAFLVIVVSIFDLYINPANSKKYKFKRYHAP